MHTCTQKSYHPILEIEENREILSRNLGVRVVCTSTVALYGFMNRHLFSDIISSIIGVKDAMSPSGFESRLFTYHPGAQQCSLLFCSYQLKNTIDFFLYQEEYINLLHHIVSVMMAFICMHPGSTHIYVAASSSTEIPATISSIYVHFDENMRGHIPGLGKLFPKTKLILSLASGGTFLFFRIYFWFFVYKHYLLDLRRALKTNRPSCQKWKKWIPPLITLSGILFYIQLMLLTTVLTYAVKMFTWGNMHSIH